MSRIRVLIMGAAGRDFHNFNTFFRDRERYEVVAFTATQIPNIEGRVYPPELAGDLYPAGIPIYPEGELDDLIRRHTISQVVFSYSDVSHEYIMHKASQVLAAGADFRLMGTRHTMLESGKPVVAVCAVRTGSGKSQTTRHVCDALQRLGHRVVVIRHPMPYGDLVAQKVQRFADYADLDRQNCTIEEREEYEPHIDRGVVVYAGVDYEAILREAERRQTSSSGMVATMTCLFTSQTCTSWPIHIGRGTRPATPVRQLADADVVVINKIDTADLADIAQVRKTCGPSTPAPSSRRLRPFCRGSATIAGQRVLVVEDGPTLTHGEMAYGAGFVAAQRFGAAEIIDPRPYAVALSPRRSKIPHDWPGSASHGLRREQIVIGRDHQRHALRPGHYRHAH